MIEMFVILIVIPFDGDIHTLQHIANIKCCKSSERFNISGTFDVIFEVICAVNEKISDGNQFIIVDLLLLLLLLIYYC